MSQPCLWRSSSVMVTTQGPPPSFEVRPPDHELLRALPPFPHSGSHRWPHTWVRRHHFPGSESKAVNKYWSQGAGLMAIHGCVGATASGNVYCVLGISFLFLRATCWGSNSRNRTHRHRETRCLVQGHKPP